MWHKNAFGGSDNSINGVNNKFSQYHFVLKQSGSSTTSLIRHMKNKHPHIWSEIIASDRRQPKITTFQK